MATPLKIRAEAYSVVLRTKPGLEVLDDLVKFAQATDVTEARLLGRADVVLRFMREKERASEKPEKAEDSEE